MLDKKMFKISKGYEHVTKTFRIPSPLAQQLERLAGKYNISLNKLVIQCLEYALQHLCEENLEEAELCSDEEPP